jgi:hypothetical protein
VARHKSFGSPVLQSDEPLTFDLYDQQFRCAPAMQGRVLIEFIARSASGDPAAGAQAVLDFFDTAVIAADRERFKEMLEGEEYIVPMSTLTDIMDWMVEEYTGRPTEPPSPSQPGESTTGPTFAGRPSSPAEPALSSSA